MKKVNLILIATTVIVLNMVVLGFSADNFPEVELANITRHIPSNWWFGSWDKLKELQDFVSKYPDNPALAAIAQYYIGCFYYSTREYQKAIDAYKTLLNTYSSVASECAKAQYEIAQITFYHLDKPEEAITEYQKVISNYPNDECSAISQLMIGKTYLKLQDNAQAKIELQKVADNYPLTKKQQAEAYLELGNIVMSEERSEEALSYYKKAYLVCPSSEWYPRAWIVDRIRETICVKLQNKTQAKAELQNIVDSYPLTKKQQAEYYLELGNIIMSEERSEEALSYYKKALQVCPSTDWYPMAWIVDRIRETICVKLQNKTQAKAELQNIVDSYPLTKKQQAEYYLELGNIIMSEERSEEALSYYKKALQICPPAEWYPMAWIVDKIYEGFKKLDNSPARANQFIKYRKYGPEGKDKVLGTSDDLTDPLDRLDVSLNLQDKLKDGVEEDIDYEKILLILDNQNSSKTEKIEALKEIAIMRTEQNEFDEVLQICHNLLSKYPDEPTILEIEAQTHQLYAAHYLSKEEFDLSINEYKALLNLNNLLPEWHALAKDNIAHIYLLRGEPDKALYWYNKIIQEHQNLKNWPASAHFSLAEYYLSQNDKTKAKEELQTIIAEYPYSDWANPAQERLRNLQ